MIRLSDYVVKFLVKKGINDIFLVAGGEIMYLIDSVGRNKQISYIANHHEQAATMAAEAYARVKNHPGVCLVTAGPGSTNSITGVAEAWVNSIPLIVISGQVKRELIANYAKVRQIGSQEINIIDIVKPITKYAKILMKPEMIRHELEKVFYLAQSDRPGPVWLAIPLDVQGSLIDEAKLKAFLPPQNPQTPKLKKSVHKTIELLKKSKRPILICGYGIRLSRGEKLLLKLINELGIPVLTHVGGLDLIAENHPLFVGRYGPAGQRRANFALQNADLLLTIGASLNIISTGFNYQGFAPKAKKIMVNIDEGELFKPTLSIDLPIKADAKDFMKELLEQIKKTGFNFSSRWLKACQMWKEHYPTIIPDFHKNKNYVNSYLFFDQLSDALTNKDIVITGNSLEWVSSYQVFRVKGGQQAFNDKNFGSMGWCLPAAIGASAVNRSGRVILVTGDGSIQMNIQELETIKYYKLPIKIFVFNNRGYKSIRDTQNNLFGGHFVGADEKTGVSNPDFKLLAAAHSLKYDKIVNNNEIKKVIERVLVTQGPVLCEVNIAYDQVRIPRASTYRKEDGTLASRPLEDMFPFLPKEELWKNMHLFDEK